MVKWTTSEVFCPGGGPSRLLVPYYEDRKMVTIAWLLDPTVTDVLYLLPVAVTGIWTVKDAGIAMFWRPLGASAGPGILERTFRVDLDGAIVKGPIHGYSVNNSISVFVSESFK